MCPPLTAAFWSGAAVVPQSLRDIGLNGAFIESAVPWRPGTLIHLALEPKHEQNGNGNGNGSNGNGNGNGNGHGTFGIWARIVRSEADGMAVRFVHENSAERKRLREFLVGLGREMDGMRERRSENGQALIECALVMPMLILLLLNVVNFGAFLYSWITVANAARAGAQYWVIGGAMVTAPEAPNEAQVMTLVRGDLAALPNQASVEVRVCSNNQFRTPRVVCVGSGSTAPPPPDPEPGSYVLGTVDVSYTYRPLVPLAILTMPPATFRQRSAMRLLQ